MRRARRQLGCVGWLLTVLFSAAPFVQEAPAAAQSTSAPARVLEVLIESETGEPVTGASVQLRGPLPGPEAGYADSDRGMVSDSTIPLTDFRRGRYGARLPAAGLFELRVRALGYLATERRLSVSSGGSSPYRLTIRLQRDPLGVPELVARARGEARRLTGHSTRELVFRDPAAQTADLGSMLSRLEGVAVRRYGPGGQELVSVRGSRPDGVLVLLDGVPLNDPFFGSADLSTVPLASLESASVIRGATAQLGPGGLGGVIQLRSRQPDGNSVVASGAIGSFGMKNARFHVSTRGGPGALAITGSATVADNDFQYVNRDRPERPTEVRRNADARGFRVAAVAHSAGFPLTLQARFDRSERGVPGRMGTAMFEQARWRDGGAQFTGQLGKTSGPRLTAGYALREQRYADPQTATEDRLNIGSGRVGGILPFGRDGAWQIRAQAARESARGATVDGSRGRTLIGASLSRRLRTTAVDLGAAMTVDLAGGAPVWSPELGIELRAGRGISLSGRVGQSLRWPTLADLYYAPSFGIRANPRLKPERVVLDAEVGADWKAARDRASLQLAVYHRRTRDPIVWHASSTAIWQPENLDNLTAYGAELGLEWRPEPVWRLMGAVSYDRSRVGFGSNRNPLPYQPEWTGRLLVARSFAHSYVEADLALLGSRTTSLAATHSLPPFAMLDLAAGRSLRMLDSNFRIDVRVRNVLDQRHELVELYPEPGRHFELRIGFATGHGSSQAGSAHPVRKVVVGKGSARATSG